MSEFFQIDRSQLLDEQDLIDQVYPIVRALGFSAALFSYTPVGWLPSRDPGVVRRAISIGLKEEIYNSWRQHHNLQSGSALAQPASSMSHYYDVFRREMINRISPKMFSIETMLREGYENRSPSGDRWLRRIHRYGVEQLFSVPHFSVRGEYWSLGLFRYSQESSDLPPSPEQEAMLQRLVTELAEVSITQFNWRDDPQDRVKKALTKREIDCLYWSSKGCTAEEAAESMHLKVETVRKYIKNASLKLGARNKVAAVSIAHQLGLLGYTLEVRESQD